MVSIEYLAGFMDGEGSLTLWRRRRPPSVEYTTRISIANTDFQILEEIRKDFGGSLVESVHANARWKRQCSLRWASAGAERLLLEVGPYLRVKDRQAAALVEFSQYRRNVKRDGEKQGRPLLPEDLQIREVFYWRQRALNAKGKFQPTLMGITWDSSPRWPNQRPLISPEYLAGFIDADGSLMITRCHSKTQRSTIYRGKLSIGSTNWHIIHEINKGYGGITANQPAREPHWRNAYQLNWSDGNVEELLLVVGLHLRVKSRQAQILLEFVRHKRDSDQRRSGHYVTGLSQDVLELREAYYLRMKALNARGPPVIHSKTLPGEPNGIRAPAASS